MPETRRRLLSLAREPRRVPAAIARRMFPNSERFGFAWVHLPDGSVTFRERGFVSAPSPPILLARHNHEVARIHTELDGLRVRRSLEIGCGFGRLSMAIAAHSAEHLAIDINPEALASARAAYPQIDFLSGSCRALPFPDDDFPLVVTWTVLQHIRPDQIEGAAGELRRVLSAGGSLLMCEETRLPDRTGGHTWHRSVATYEQLLAPLTLVRHGVIEEIATMPGLESPGEVMLFVSNA